MCKLIQVLVMNESIINNCWFFAADINLQNLCLEKLSNWLKSTSNVDKVPLPAKLKDKIKDRL